MSRSFEQGQYGSTIIADTSAHTPSGDNDEFFCIDVIATAVFNAATAGNFTGTLAGVSFPAGSKVYGSYTTITLTSGTVVAYEGVTRAAR
jgi:hypothetical protein